MKINIYIINILEILLINKGGEGIIKWYNNDIK